MTKSNLLDELTWRGFVNQTTYKNPEAINDGLINFYWGVDPSAPSMQIGNLAMAMMVRHFINYGHSATLLVGGATGLIGDPDGKNAERSIVTTDEILYNKQGIINQYNRIFANQKYEIVDNYDWFKELGYIEFLRNIGKHMPMSQMLQREFVQTRLGESGTGISYAEFSYSLIQGYDFLHLYKTKNVTLQVCGSDQWGNSLAGVDLIRRIENGEAHVWSAPLVLNKSTGLKFGKSEDGAIWLDENLTSVFKFYQFWLNLEDDGVESYLKIYTLLSSDEINQLMSSFDNDKSSRIAQKTLAYEVVKIVHGNDRAESVVKVSNVLFGSGEFTKLDKEEIEMLKAELNVVDANDDVFQTIVDCNLATSKSEARNFVKNGAISINNTKINNENNMELLHGPNLIKRGKNHFAIVIKK